MKLFARMAAKKKNIKKPPSQLRLGGYFLKVKD